MKNPYNLISEAGEKGDSGTGSNFIEIALRHGCSSLNLLYILTTLFPKNTSERLLLLYTSVLGATENLKNCCFSNFY